MAKKYIYIDESGDPGMKDASSRNFVVASVVVGQENKNEIEAAIVNYCRELRWGEHAELKFHKTHKVVGDKSVISHQKNEIAPSPEGTSLPFGNFAAPSTIFSL